MNVIIKPSTKKKFDIYLPNKKLSIGDPNYEDYTQHKDKERKKRYYQRMPLSTDITKRQFWANNLLWNKPTIEQSIRDIEKKYNINIIFLY
jgi:hypothetical protein